MDIALFKISYCRINICIRVGGNCQLNINISMIKKNKFLKGVLWITGGTAFAQFINAILSPIITRIYTPEEYGMLTIYIATVSIITITGSFMYELAIPIAEDEDSAVNIIALCIIILFALSLILTLFLFMHGNTVLRVFRADALLGYKYLIPIGVFFTGLYTIVVQYAYRKQNFKSISKTKGYQSLSQGFIQITYTFISSGPLGLIAGRIIGQSAGFLSLGKPLLLNFCENAKKVNITSMVTLAKRYIRFPLYLMPSQLLNTVSVYIPALFIGMLFQGEVVGLYGLANSMVNLPMTLLGSSVADVFYSEAAYIGRKNPTKLKKMSRKIFRQLFMIGLIPLFTLLLFGPVLFSIVFGNTWYEAGVFSRAIAFMVFARFIFTPISKVYVVFERQKESLYLNVLRLIFAVGVFLVAKKYGLTPFETILFYSLSMAFVYFVTFLGAQKIMDLEIKKSST